MSHVLAARRSFHSELIKLWRPSTLVAMGILALLSTLATILIVALADPADPSASGGGPPSFDVTTDALSSAAGLSRGFTGGSSFTGLLVFLVFAITITTEYSQGTLRTLLLREPRRLGWLAGRVGVMLSLVAVALLAALAISMVVGVVAMGIRGIDTSAWWSSAAAGEAASSYLNALVSAVFFGLAGTVLGIVLRSTALTLAVGIAWTFPLEHIVQDAWSGSSGVFPGLVFDAIGQGGVADVSYGAALLTGALYAIGAAVIGALSLARRDVTA